MKVSFVKSLLSFLPIILLSAPLLAGPDTSEETGIYGYIATSSTIQFDGTTLKKMYEHFGFDGARDTIDSGMMNKKVSDGLSIYTRQNQNPHRTSAEDSCKDIFATNIPMARKVKYHKANSSLTGLPYLGNEKSFEDGSTGWSDIWTPACKADKKIYGETFAVINGSTYQDTGGLGFYLAAGKNRLIPDHQLFAQSKDPDLNKSDDNSAIALKIQPRTSVWPFKGPEKSLSLKFTNRVPNFSDNHRQLKLATVVNLYLGSKCHTTYGSRCTVNLYFVHNQEDRNGEYLLDKGAKVFFDKVQGGKAVITSPITESGTYSTFKLKKRYQNTQWALSKGAQTQKRQHETKTFEIELPWNNFLNGLRIVTLDFLIKKGSMKRNQKVTEVTDAQIESVFGTGATDPDLWQVKSLNFRSEFDNPDGENVEHYIGTSWEDAILQAK